MKVLAIRLKNLNSLSGEWQIDLTHPAYLTETIFAITGPTGSGKSTILDAICLALYGRTPRLPRVNQNSNEIMARLAGDCFAEVTFSTAGGSYRAHWSQRKARQRPDGKLQPPRHEVSVVASGAVLAAKLGSVAETVKQLTGLDYDRFTRSMLLAQGEFAAFLQADADERAPLLEEITGTAIYSQISITVHEQLRAGQQKLELLQATLAGFTLLSDAEVAELNAALERGTAEAVLLTAELERLGHAINWHKRVLQLETECRTTAAELAALQLKNSDFAPQRKQLQRALQAARLDVACAALTALRRQQQTTASALKRLADSLPPLEEQQQQQVQRHQAASAQVAALRQAEREAAPLRQQVRLLDQEINSSAIRLQESRAALQQLHAKTAHKEQELARLRHEQQAATEAQQQSQRYLQQQAPDEWLVGGLAAIETTIHRLQGEQQRLTTHKRQLQRADQQLQAAAATQKAASAAVAAAREALATLEQQQQAAGQQLLQLLGGKLLREHQAHKDALQRELNLLATIATLDQERQRLTDGKPCPLCGATEHPYASGNQPQPDATERAFANVTQLINTATQQEEALRTLERAEQAGREQLSHALQQEVSANAAYERQADARRQLESASAELKEEIAALKRAMLHDLTPLAVTEAELDTPAPLLAGLQQRRAAWLAATTAAGVQSLRLVALTTAQERVTGELNVLQEEQQKQQHLVETQKSDLTKLKLQRSELYGSADPAAEETRLLAEREAAEQHELQQRQQLEATGQQLTAARSKLATLQQQQATREQELQQQEHDLVAQLPALGFATEAELQAARLAPPLLEQLQATASAIERELIELQARQQDRTSRLAAARDEQLAAEPLTELESRFAALAVQERELHEQLATRRHRLQEQAAAAERYATQQAAIAQQRVELQRWEALHQLIGSADGKKYRNFVQGLTFELMVQHANRQLQQMSDRYLLSHDPQKPLELQVIDGYQAGVVRSTKNLSGGESFIVSLALALGLARMASRRVQVDSLFLDEGFGTLDAEALDVALETLATLQQDGKLIGVISHVPALQERLATHIRVIPQSGGHSRLSGPGVTAVSLNL